MDKTPEKITRQAAEYFAQRGGATSAQRQERDAWLQEDARNAKAYEGFEDLWDRAGDLAADNELQALMQSDLAAARKARWARPPRWLAIAATVVVMAGVGYLVQPWRAPPPEPVSYFTALGERRTETLSDGTAILLNTDSLVQARYAENLRGIALERGEAQFNVARDASRPFVVTTGQDTVTALGTKFQVRRDSDETRVTLLEGKVEVARGNERYVLRPNERAVLSDRTGIAITSIDPESATGWLEGWLRFRGEPLSEVIAEANRYSNEKLRLGDPRLADVELSGNFHAGDNASIAQAAGLILALRVERRGTEWVLLPK